MSVLFGAFILVFKKFGFIVIFIKEVFIKYYYNRSKPAFSSKIKEQSLNLNNENKIMEKFIVIKIETIWHLLSLF